jgi:hypothetical protein
MMRRRFQTDQFSAIGRRYQAAIPARVHGDWLAKPRQFLGTIHAQRRLRGVPTDAVAGRHRYGRGTDADS